MNHRRKIHKRLIRTALTEAIEGTHVSTNALRNEKQSQLDEIFVCEFDDCKQKTAAATTKNTPEHENGIYISNRQKKSVYVRIEVVWNDKINYSAIVYNETETRMKMRKEKKCVKFERASKADMPGIFKHPPNDTEE